MRLPAIISYLLFSCCLQAQVSFKTVIPQEPVVAGDAFQVQYVLTGAERTSAIRTPVFAGFRLISGPNIYGGAVVTADGKLPVQNFVYTLEALRPGKYIIPAALVALNNKPLPSNEVMLRVISREEAAKYAGNKEEQFSADYFLRPGEDPYKKIKENLFVKVQVDKRSCLVGEPVLATFKLYSRLESKSDIVKNPGFYGFTVYDMAGLADKMAATEKINGRFFDVHTIRKVQLYPLQAGRFSIDAMEVKNRVEFSRSAVNRKTEQQIAEGMMGVEESEPVKEGTDLYETTMSTEPAEVEVKPLPEKIKPANFNGAVGRFSIKSVVPSASLAKNEQGFFEIVIEGKGNFTQLDAPVVQWPPGVEGFEPVVKDELDKTKVPLQGSRTFRYPFVCAAAGNYTLPSVSFSFFDSDSNSYKTVTALPVAIAINNRQRSAPVAEENKTSFAEQNEKAARTGGLIAIATVLLVLSYWVFGKKEKKKPAIVPGIKPVWPSPQALLQPAQDAADDKQFYRALQSAIWQFAAQRFNLSGSGMSKEALVGKTESIIKDRTLAGQLQVILEKCEAGLFTNAELPESREALLQQTKELLEKTDAALL